MKVAILVFMAPKVTTCGQEGGGGENKPSKQQAAAATQSKFS